jgi:hypothetical protein
LIRNPLFGDEVPVSATIADYLIVMRSLAPLARHVRHALKPVHAA